MKSPPRVNGPAAALAAALVCSGAAHATSAEKPASSSDSAAIFPGTNSKEPITIDADKLVYYDKEHKAIYSGNVVVIQGDTKMTCTIMTVFLDRSPAQGQGQAAAPAKGLTMHLAGAIRSGQRKRATLVLGLCSHLIADVLPSDFEQSRGAVRGGRPGRPRLRSARGQYRRGEDRQLADAPVPLHQPGPGDHRDHRSPRLGTGPRLFARYRCEIVRRKSSLTPCPRKL